MGRSSAARRLRWPLRLLLASAAAVALAWLQAAEGAATQTVSLANGLYTLSWNYPPNTDLIEFTVSAHGTGWVGLGVAANATSAMVGADIVMARVLPDGSALIDDMWATTFAPPQPDSELGGSPNAQLVSGSESGGITTVTFRRPLAATDPEHDRAIIPDAANNLICAFNADSDDITQYHGPDHRVMTTVTLLS